MGNPKELEEVDHPHDTGSRESPRVRHGHGGPLFLPTLVQCPSKPT